MSDQVFGVAIPNPEDLIVATFPHDPDYGFRKTREYKTVTHRFSPVLAQRFIVAAEPTIKFSLGFSAAKGDLLTLGSKYYEIWDFFNERRARGTPFYFYDPTHWSRHPNVEYRDQAWKRGEFSGSEVIDGITYSKYLGRHVCLFDEDEMSAEAFERKVRRMDLRIVGYESFSDV